MQARCPGKNVGLAMATAKDTAINSQADDRPSNTRRAVSSSATPAGMASTSLVTNELAITKPEVPTMTSVVAAAIAGDTRSRAPSQSSEAADSTVNINPATR